MAGYVKKDGSAKAEFSDQLTASKRMRQSDAYYRGPGAYSG